MGISDEDQVDYYGEARKKVGKLWASLMELLYVGCSMVTMSITVIIMVILFSKF